MRLVSFVLSFFPFFLIIIFLFIYFMYLFFFLRETLAGLCLCAGFLLGRQRPKMTRFVHLLNLLILSARVRGKMVWEESRDLTMTVPREDVGYIINNAPVLFYFLYPLKSYFYVSGDEQPFPSFFLPYAVFILVCLVLHNTGPIFSEFPPMLHLCLGC